MKGTHMKYLLIALSFILAGCVTTPEEEIAQGYTLQADEGFVLASLDCGAGPRMGLKINRSGDPVGVNMPDGRALLPVGNFENVSTLTCETDGVALIALPRGDYYFGSMVEAKLLGAHFNIGEKRSPQFTVQPGKINYIGRFQLGFHRPAPGEPLGNEYALRKSNNFDIDEILFKSQYPIISQKYPLIINLAR